MSKSIQPPVGEPAAYVTIIKAMYGYKPCLVWWNHDEGFYEPWQTGYFQYPTEQEAIPEAKDWAESEGIPFRP